MESIADFANFYTLENDEVKLAEEAGKAGFMHIPLQTSRLRTAWQLARAELARSWRRQLAQRPCLLQYIRS